MNTQRLPLPSWRSWIEVFPFYVFLEDIHYPEDESCRSTYDEYSTTHLHPTHIPLLLSITNEKNSADALHRRFDRGDTCLGIFHKQNLVSFGWITYDRMDFGSYKLALLENEAYLFDLFVIPAYRGKGLAGYTRQRVHNHIKEKGIQYALSISISTNKPAIRFKEKLGVQIIDRGISIKLFNRWRIGTQAHPEKLRSSTC